MAHSPAAAPDAGWWTPRGAAAAGAVLGASATGVILAVLLSRERRKRARSQRLGPPIPADALRYELALRGRVDRIYAGKRGPKPFEFNEEVVRVFDDMVSRSVPLYCEVIDLLLYWVQRYFQPGTAIVDLGCSTGTTLDVVARFLTESAPAARARLVGVDNSRAMVEECKNKLAWASDAHSVEIHAGDIVGFKMPPSSLVIMNYTLQFIPIAQRAGVLADAAAALCDGGILFLSEKVRTDDAEFQEACTWVYEDFKHRRGYSQREIARKKDALMNVLVPYTEQEMRQALRTAGFCHTEIVAKWNNFTTFVARKAGPSQPAPKAVRMPVATPALEALFDQAPVYLTDLVEPHQLPALCRARLEAFALKSGASDQTLAKYDAIARTLLDLPSSSHCIAAQSIVELGDPSLLSAQQADEWRKCTEALRPWKKGPLRLFGVDIDTEWRSDWKWERLERFLPDLDGKAVCDLGCGNGYFMFRMLAHNPKVVVGIDPNLHAWLEFAAFRRLSGVTNLHLELLRGDSMTLFPNTFDVVFCLGVLYHTPDPVGMLRDIHKSMRKGGHLFVDCSGIPGDDPVALFPQKRYANMTGVYFLPTVAALKHWLQRASFIDQEVIFAEKLSVDEQRITEWAPVNTSLKESLSPTDDSLTIEGYPAPHRFYIRAKRG